MKFETQTPPPPPPKASHRLLPTNWGVLSLSKDHWFIKRALELLDSNMTFAAFVAVILLIFNWNSHLAEKKARSANALRQEIKELKSEFMTLNARLSTNRQQSEITRSADTLGLSLPEQPPYKLVLESN